MPKIRNYNDLNLGQVRPTTGRVTPGGNTPYQRLNTNADMFGASAGRDMQRAAQGVNDASNQAFKVALQEKQRNDMFSVMRGEALWKAVESEKKRQLDATGGMKARGISNKASEWWDSPGDEEGGEPSQAVQAYRDFYATMSEEARERLKITRLQRRAPFIDHVARHETAQVNAAYVQEIKASIQQSEQMAVDSWDNPKAVAFEKSEIEYMMKQIAEINGVDAKTTRIAIEESQAKVNMGILQQHWNNNDPHGAEAFYKNIKDDMPPKLRADIESKMKERTLLGNAQSERNRIIQLPFSEQMDAVMKIKDPEVQQKTWALVGAWQGKDKERKAIQYSNAYDDLLGNIVDGNIVDESQLNPAQWDMMTGGDKITLRKVIDNQSHVEPPKVSDFEAYGQLAELAAVSPEKFSRVKLGDYFNSLSSTDMKHFADLKANIKKGAKEDSQTLPVKMNDTLNHFFQAKGWAGEDYKQLKGEVRFHLDQSLNSAQAKKGEPLTDIEKSNVMFETLNPDYLTAMSVKYRDAERKDVATLTQQISSAKDEFNLLYGEVKGEDKLEREAAFSRFEKAIRDKITKAESPQSFLDSGRTLSYSEREEIMATMMADKVMVDVGFIGSDKERVYAGLTKEELDEAYVVPENLGEKVWIKDMKKMERDTYRKISEELQDAGKPTTVANIAETWVRQYKTSYLKDRKPEDQFPEPDNATKATFFDMWSKAKTSGKRRTLESRIEKQFGAKAVRKLVDQASKVKGATVSAKKPNPDYSVLDNEALQEIYFKALTGEKGIGKEVPVIEKEMAKRGIPLG